MVVADQVDLRWRWQLALTGRKMRGRDGTTLSRPFSFLSFISSLHFSFSSLPLFSFHSILSFFFS